MPIIDNGAMHQFSISVTTYLTASVFACCQCKYRTVGGSRHNGALAYHSIDIRKQPSVALPHNDDETQLQPQLL